MEDSSSCIEEFSSMTAVTILVSGSGESSKLKSIGIVSPLPEKFSCDVVCLLPNRLTLLFQRKTVVDFLASLNDGRLSKDLAKTEEDEFRYLIFEGEPKYDKEGFLLRPWRSRRGKVFPKPTRFKREHLMKMLFSVRYTHGVEVLHTKDLNDTILTIQMLAEYLSKETHLGFLQRPKIRGEWGIPSGEERKLNFLQGLPGVGVKIAKGILAAGEGNIPMQWVVTKEELMEIPFIGEAKGEKIWGFIPEWEPVGPLR